MARDFGLIYLQNFYEKTYANFVVPDQIDQSQTSAIRERPKEQCDAVFLVDHAVFAYPVVSLIVTILTTSEFLFPRLI